MKYTTQVGGLSVSVDGPTSVKVTRGEVSVVFADNEELKVLDRAFSDLRNARTAVSKAKATGGDDDA